jgi:hypothetical protein
LLDDLQSQVQAFFDKQLQKQKLRLDDEAGFLDGGDFNRLFNPLKPLLKIVPGDTQQQINDKLKENEKIEKENAEELQRRHLHVAKVFLPFLQKRLIRQFIIQTLTAQTGADQVLVESLLTDSRLLGETQPAGALLPLMAAFTATGERGLTATFFATPDGSGASLGTLAFADADTGLKDNRGNQLKPGGANSAQFEGYLEVPAPGAYRFYILLDRKNAEGKRCRGNIPSEAFRDAAGENRSGYCFNRT